MSTTTTPATPRKRTARKTRGLPPAGDGHTPQQKFRCPDELWAQFDVDARAAGFRDRSDALRAFIRDLHDGKRMRG